MLEPEILTSSDEEFLDDQQQTDVIDCTVDSTDCIEEFNTLPGTSNQTRTKSTQAAIKPDARSVETQTIADSSSTFFQVKPMTQSVQTQTSVCGAPTVVQNVPVESLCEAVSTSKITPAKEIVDPEITGLDCHAPASEDSDRSNDNFSANEATSAESENCEDEEESEEVVKCTLLRAGKPPQEQIKFIVFKDAILHTLGKCGQCGSKCVVAMEKQIGSCCEICTTCTVDSNHYFEWATGPIMKRMPPFHLLLASGILATGMETSKVRLFNSLIIPNVQRRELTNLLKFCGIPAIYNVWQKEQSARIKEVEGKKIVIASDMRVDSPGHSGLFGSGSTLDMESNIILDTQVIKVNK